MKKGNLEMLLLFQPTASIPWTSLGEFVSSNKFKALYVYKEYWRGQSLDHLEAYVITNSQHFLLWHIYTYTFNTTL